MTRAEQRGSNTALPTDRAEALRGIGRLTPTRLAGGIFWGTIGAATILLVTLGSPTLAAASCALSGERAFGDLKRLVSFVPRPAGSEALGETRQCIIRELKRAGAEVEEDAFVASTPAGDTPMTNVIAKIR